VTRAPIRWKELGLLEGQFWLVVAVGAVLTMARFSEAFLVLRARDAGLTLALVPLVFIVMNIAYAVSAYPMGVLSDRVGRRLILVGGFAVLIVADIVLASGSSILSVMFGVGAWGVHMGMTQGLLTALVSDVAPDHLRGTAFGLFHLTTGIAMLLASFVAGGLWEWIGPSATFSAGAVFTALGLTGALIVGRRSIA
jgi:MFS family permease